VNIFNENKFHAISGFFFCYRDDEQKQEKGSSPTSHKRKKHLRKADTNVLSVRFNRLLQPGNKNL
jgi:hypothetical protein